MSAPSKPKFLLSSPALSRRQSYTTTKKQKEKSIEEPHASANHDKYDKHDKTHESPARHRKPKSRVGALVKDVIEFNRNANQHFNPQYQDFERSMSELLERFQTQVEQYQAARTQAQEMIESFETQIKDTKSVYKNEMERIHQWQAPAERITEMQDRVANLKNLLAQSKEKLARIDAELTIAENESLVESKRRRDFNWTLTIVIIVIAIITSIIAKVLS